MIARDHIEAPLKLFDPAVNLGELGAPQVLTDIYGDTGRVIPDTLRTATAPLSTAKVCDAVMKARALDTNDKGLCRLMMKRTAANLKHWSKELRLGSVAAGSGSAAFVR